MSTDATQIAGRARCETSTRSIKVIFSRPLIASDLPFRKIIGVEFVPALHGAALENVRRYRSPLQRCTAIECVLEEATRYRLPPEPSLLYFYDPFDRRVLATVLDGVEQSIQAHPRDVVILAARVWPDGSVTGCFEELDSRSFLSRRSHQRLPGEEWVTYTARSERSDVRPSGTPASRRGGD